MQKFTLKPVNKPAGMDQARAYDMFVKIAEAIHHINSANSSHLSFEELYRCVDAPLLVRRGSQPACPAHPAPTPLGSSCRHPAAPARPLLCLQL